MKYFTEKEIKNGIKDGTIKSYKEALEEHDPALYEDYEFPGFYISEATNLEYDYNIGDIVFIKKYKYKNGTNGNNHLFVIVEEDNRIVPLEYFCMLISSNLDKLKFKSNKLLKKDNINNLNKDSIVKLDQMYKFNINEISYKIGKVNKKLVEEYKNIYLNTKHSLFEIEKEKENE